MEQHEVYNVTHDESACYATAEDAERHFYQNIRDYPRECLEWWITRPGEGRNEMLHEYEWSSYGGVLDGSTRIDDADSEGDS